MTATHPPVAKGVVCVDFDGTIRPWGGLFDTEVAPFPGVPEAMEALELSGYRIVILTSRLSRRWLRDDFTVHGFTTAKAFRAANLRYIRSFLRRHGIAFHEITAEKVPAVAYFDDLAVAAAEGSLPSGIRFYLYERGEA